MIPVYYILGPDSHATGNIRSILIRQLEESGNIIFKSSNLRLTGGKDEVMIPVYYILGPDSHATGNIIFKS